MSRRHTSSAILTWVSLHDRFARKVPLRYPIKKALLRMMGNHTVLQPAFQHFQEVHRQERIHHRNTVRPLQYASHQCETLYTVQETLSCHHTDLRCHHILKVLSVHRTCKVRCEISATQS